MRIAVYCDSSIVVTVPLAFDFSRVENFVREKFDWIFKTLQRFSANGPVRDLGFLKSSRRDYKKYQSAVLEFAKNKVQYWNQFYGFSFNNINIKNQRTRWGSCSKKGNLNFNYRIFQLPENVADYLVVHELCHLQEFNHGKNFWSLVAKTMPDYKTLRAQLKNV